MDIKQEDLIKFWTWCGFTQYPAGRKNFHYERTVKVMDWIPPKGHYGGGNLPRLGLDEIYEYAIPKLSFVSLDWFNNEPHKPHYTATVQPKIGEQHYADADNPTEALYKAIMAVIDKG